MLKKHLAVFIILFCLGISATKETIKLVEIEIPSHSEVYELSRLHITIVDAGSDYAHALVNETETAKLTNAGYKVHVLIKDYQAYKDDIFQRGFYHTYDQVYSVLDSFATDYANICRLDTIGFSVLGRAIWAMRVTDNPQIEENEPEIRLAGNMHGDEHIGTEVTLFFLRHLLTNYAIDPQVQDLVDNNEIWILPTINPDGKAANTRRNANNVDLNRDYGYFWDGWGGSTAPSSQIENQLMMQHLEENNIGLEYNYHSVAQYVNYPWDYHMADPPDSQHIITLSEIYADSANLTAINGYAWYQTTGGLQDYTIGTSGALAWTIETLEPSASQAIDQICYDNRDALMDICARAGWGIRGVVKDSLSGSPLHARIEFVDPARIDIYSDPVLGDFHKMTGQGTYDLRISANGYAPKTINNVSAPASGNVSVGDVLLVPDSSYLHAYRVVLCRYAEHAEQGNKTQTRFALGAPDNQFFSLGQDGFVVVDMGPDTPIHNSPGHDFTVYEGNDNADEGYEVFVSDNWTGTWQSCGSATGTADFDLSTAGLSVARYVRIVDDGSATSGQYAGFDVDAVQALPPANLPNLFVAGYQILDGNGILEPGETADLIVSLSNAGNIAANNISAFLITNDAYLLINDSSAVYGSILPESTVTNNSDPFNITALPSTPYAHEAGLQLVVTGTGYLDTIDLTVTIGIPVPTDTGYYYVYYSGGPHTYSPVFDWIAIDST
ncbi:MAG: M14 family zinc carboxypeptidase, partial [candidate division WOR-3 bacterium]